MTSSVVRSDQYFSDGQRLIDYVLVYEKENNDERRTKFLTDMESKGFILEYSEIKDNVFVKVHLTEALLLSYATELNVPLKMHKKVNYVNEQILESTIQKKNHIYYDRVMAIPKNLTTHERQFIVWHVLKTIRFGDRVHDIGITNLIRLKVFTDAFALHDGNDYSWPKDENEKPTDRQLLFHYWANFRYIFQSQPIVLIERYFGSDTAMYFVLMDHYTKMLGVAVLISIVYLIISISMSFDQKNEYIKEGCESNITICPMCIECKPTKLNDECHKFFISYLLDNTSSVFFAMSIAVWGCLFITTWKRKQSVFSLMWALDSKKKVKEIRPEFIMHARKRRGFFNENELYVPTWIQILLTALIVIFMFLIGFFLVSIMMTIIYLQSLNEHVEFSVLIGILLQSSINFVAKGYNFIINHLTKMELHATQAEFNDAYILKLFIFSFINSYSSLFCISFFQKNSYTHPNDPEQQITTRNIFKESCKPYGCTPEIFIMLFSMMSFTPLAYIVQDLLFAYIQKICNYLPFKSHRNQNQSILEENYKLRQSTHDMWQGNYDLIAIQYGLVTMFAVAFPFAPLFAFVMNLINIRKEAMLLLTSKRREPGNRRDGIGTWLKIYTYLSYSATMTNGFYLTFTTEFIERLLYKYYNEFSLAGFIESTLSGNNERMYWIRFAFLEYQVDPTIWPTLNGTDYCYYVGDRYAPGHYYQYEIKQDHYATVAIKLGFLLIFEHIVLTVAVSIGFVIPDIPRNVKKVISYLKNEKQKINDFYDFFKN